MTPHRSQARVAAVIAAAAIGLAGCRSPVADLTAAPTNPPRSSAPAPASVAAGQLTLIQEPGAGSAPIERALGAARRSIEMTMYELADRAAQAALIAAHHRGVTVRVILDRAFHGHQVNQGAYRQLTAAGVTVRWAPAGQIFHQKTVTIDAARALIGTGNLATRYYPDSRDAWIDDRNPAQVHAITATFAADWANAKHSGNAVAATGLMWSPGAQQQMVAEIDTARTSLEFTSEELTDTKVVDALAAAARRGVGCRIVMTASAQWEPAFTTVTAAGCTVHTFPDTPAVLYIHEKLILIDGTSMLIGSQNATRVSLDTNRELSVIVTSPALVKAAAATFGTDYRAASTWPL